MTDGPGDPAMGSLPEFPGHGQRDAAEEVSKFPPLSMETWKLFAAGPTAWAEPMGGRSAGLRGPWGQKRAIGPDDPTRATGPKGGVLAPWP